MMKLYKCSLLDLLEGVPSRVLPVPTVLRVGAQLAHAVGELHEHHIILRDLKVRAARNCAAACPPHISFYE